MHCTCIKLEGRVFKYSWTKFKCQMSCLAFSRSHFVGRLHYKSFFSVLILPIASSSFSLVHVVTLSVHAVFGFSVFLVKVKVL